MITDSATTIVSSISATNIDVANADGKAIVMLDTVCHIVVN